MPLVIIPPLLFKKYARSPEDFKMYMGHFATTSNPLDFVKLFSGPGGNMKNIFMFVFVPMMCNTG